MRKRICMLAAVLALSFCAVQPSMTVFADETTSAEEETSKDSNQESKDDKKQEETSKEAETKKPEPTKEEKQPTKEAKEPTKEQEETSASPEETASEVSYVMPVLTGYLFEDGSFDVWARGSGLYVGDGKIVIPARLSYSTYPNGDSYQELMEAKKTSYATLELEPAVLELTTAIVLPNGEWEKCELQKTNDSSALCLMTFRDAGLSIAIPTYSRDAWPDTVNLVGYQGPGMAKMVEDLQAGQSVRTAKAVSMESEKDVYTSSEEQVGSVVTNAAGEVIGMVTKHSTDKAAVVRTGDILKLLEEEKPTEPETTNAPEYDDNTDKELLNTIETLESKIKSIKDTDYSGYTEDSVEKIMSAIEKAEADLRTATPDLTVLKSDITAIDEAISSLEQKPVKSGSGSLVAVIILIILILAVLAVIVVVPFIVFKKPKEKPEKESEEQTKDDKPKEQSAFMVKLAKLLGVKLKDTGAQAEQPEKKKEEKTGEVKTKDGYGGELARAMYEAEQQEKQAEQPQAVEKTETEEKEETPAPKNVVLGQGGTSVLQKKVKEVLKPKKIAWLLDSAGNKIIIDKAEFLIGREQLAVDLCVDNATVGRRHAIIRMDGDTYTIEDNGSVNKTFLNGVQLQKGVPVKLTNQDVITVSDVSFTFRDKED